MASKENIGYNTMDATSVKVKTEEPRVALLPTSSWNAAPSTSQNGLVKFEPEDDTGLLPEPPKTDVTPAIPVATVAPKYTKYTSVEEIDYVPEDALKQGLGMVASLKDFLKKLELGSKLRQEVWMRDMANLESQGSPRTLIAICGATGAGKSSIINAVLQDNIVPTSGMRACTAVVTEIAYHKKKTIEADVSFLSLEEWKAELKVLLDDLVDDDGSVKRSTDLRSDSGVAWHKVHAVYPHLSADQLPNMTVDKILSLDQKVVKALGTVKKITAFNSKQFSAEISKYIDSKEKTREKKKGDKSNSKEKEREKKDDGPAWWPLIKVVKVRCNSKALSSGAILVDLPGVADANVARGKIAHDYMKTANCIWILASIHRAVDDKTAKDLLGDAFKTQLLMDGNYDSTCITFVATKTDDIAASEVIGALHLDDDPDLEKLEEVIDVLQTEFSDAKGRKVELEKNLKAANTEHDSLREILSEYRDHLKAIQDGETFTPELTAKKRKSPEASPSRKRKKTESGRKGSVKRRKSTPTSDEEDEEMNSDDNSDAASDDFKSGSASDNSDSDHEEQHDDDDSEVVEVIEIEDDDQDPPTEEEIKAKITEHTPLVKSAKERAVSLRQEKKECVELIGTLKKKLSASQREKNAFCARKRSEYSKDVLKEDFRTGLREIDEAAALEKDAASFDPGVALRDYSVINLPVFCVSSRDYVRIHNQAKGDGEPSCFTDENDTGIPALQEWCHSLTISSRERAARSFMSDLNTFCANFKSYVDDTAGVKQDDRDAMRMLWETCEPDDGLDDDDSDSEDYVVRYMAQMSKKPDSPKNLFRDTSVKLRLDENGEVLGVTSILVENLSTVIDTTVDNLKAKFKVGLEEKCQAGAAKAAAAAVNTSDTFAASMHWQTFRATLRRLGAFRRDLNAELIAPLTSNIAHSWAQVFESDLFASFQEEALKAISTLLVEVESSAAPGLKERCKAQSELAQEEAKTIMKKVIQMVGETLNTEQKEISRCLTPHVQEGLTETYYNAAAERGTGSVARQKAYVRQSVDQRRHTLFTGGTHLLLERLSKAAEAVGTTLEVALSELAEKIEVSMAVLWEGSDSNIQQMLHRQAAMSEVTDILKQLKFWKTAEASRPSSVVIEE